MKIRNDIETGILDVIEQRGSASYAELMRELGHLNVRGDYAICAGGDENLVIWPGISEAFGSAVSGLIQAGLVHHHAVAALIYALDGDLPMDLPVAQRVPATGYKSPHWIPSVLRHGPAPAPVQE